LLVLVNCRNNAVSFNLDAGLSAGNWTDLMSGQTVQLNSNLNLNAGAYFIYKRN